MYILYTCLGLLAPVADQGQTFWLFQTYLRDLSNLPYTNAFRTCRRIYNKVQRIVFGASEPSRRERIKDNVLPTTVLSSIVLASVAAPFLPAFAGPLAIAQARKPRPVEQLAMDNVGPQTRPQRSHTVSEESPRPRRTRPGKAGTARPSARSPAQRVNLSIDVTQTAPLNRAQTDRLPLRTTWTSSTTRQA